MLRLHDLALGERSDRACDAGSLRTAPTGQRQPVDCARQQHVGFRRSTRPRDCQTQACGADARAHRVGALGGSRGKLELPMAKARVFAEAAARIVADDIAARLRGDVLERPYEGAGTCYIELGDGEVGMVEANFFGGPAPTARLVGPSREFAADNAAFAATRQERWFGSEGSPLVGATGAHVAPRR
jgi:hypothetical protein